MNARFLRICLLALCLAPLASSLRAQTPAPRPVVLRFLFLDESAGAYELKTGDQFRPISSAPYMIGAPVAPPRGGRLEIYKTSPVPDPETGAPIRIPVASFAAPQNTSSALVIVTPRPAPAGSDAPLAYGVEFVDDDSARFPGGSIRILNRGHAPMAGRFAADQILVQPGATQIIAPSADHRGRVRASIAVQNGEAWKLIDDNVAVVKPETRLTGVLLYSPSGLKFRLGADLLIERGDPPPGHVWLTYSDTP